MQHNAYSLATLAAREALVSYPLTSKFIFDRLVPLKPISFFCHGIAAPSFAGINTVETKEYVDLWQFNVNDSLSTWLRIFKVLRDKGLHVEFMRSWNIFDYHFNLYVPIDVDRSKLLIPMVIGTSSYHGTRSRSTMVTLSDYIKHTNRTPARFAIDMMQIIIFGFIVDRVTVRNLGLEGKILPYVIRVLRQGEIDSLILRSLNRTGTSAFDPIYSSSRTSLDYVKIGKGLSNYIDKGGIHFKKTGIFPTIPNGLVQQINALPSLGPFADNMRQIGAMGGIPQADYARYLARTIGPNNQYYSPQAYVGALNQLVQNNQYRNIRNEP